MTLLSCMVNIGLGAYLVHDRQNIRARYLIFLLAGATVWTGAYAMELLSPGLATKLMWMRLEYFGSGCVGLLLFRFILVAVEDPGPLAWGLSGWLWLMPGLILVSVFTNDWHHLMWKDAWLAEAPGIQALQYNRGYMFWAHTVFSYALIGMAFVLLIQGAVSASGLKKKKILILIAGMVIPWVANGVYLTGMPGLTYVDLSPTAFMASCLVFTLGLFRYHLIHLVPLAHKAVMDGLGDPVIVLDMEDRVVEINRACAKAFCMDPSPVSPVLIEQALPRLYRMIRQSRGRQPVELQMGSEIQKAAPKDWYLRISPLWRNHKEQSGWLILLRDITLQKQGENALRRAKDYVKSIINSMPSVIIGVDPKGVVTQWNRDAAQMTGVTENQAVGKEFTVLFPQLSSFRPDLHRAMETRAAQSREKQILALKDKNMVVDVMIFPILSDAAPGAVIRVDDISEQTRTREMMVQSEKMMSVGGLAAGMAHEINNPLSGMIQNIQVVKSRLSRPLPANLKAAQKHGIDLEQVKDYMKERKLFQMVDQAVANGIRAAGIVDNMLSFSRKDGDPKQAQSLPEMMDATIALLENDFNLKKDYHFRRLAFASRGRENFPPVPCERSKIQQVFFNILKNGAQAMAQAGVEAPKFLIHYFLSRDMACVEIQDNGPGIPEKIRERIFEPFFTTKPVGTGTGLGLSVSYFIVVEGHQGLLQVSSSPGRGTSFIVSLPLAN
jgi:PAS domain S-box-containing protein